jgi:tetratricopeptide (TPR) repeat protein
LGIRKWFLLALLAVGIVMPTVASAMDTPDDKAKEWYESGKAFYQEASYGQALVAFETAYRLSKRPVLLRSIGYCYEKLDRLEESLDVYYRWLGLADPGNYQEIERHIRRIEQAIEGENEVVAPSVSAPAPAPKKRADRPEPVQERPGWRMGTGPSVLYGITAVSAITGTVFAIQADQARKAAAELCSTGDAVFCTGTAANSISRDRTFSGIADLSFGVGGVAIVAGTLWMVIDNSKHTSVRVGPVGQGLGFLGTF